MKNLSHLLLLTFFLTTVTYCSNNDPLAKQLLDDITNQIDENGFSLEKEDEYSKRLRPIYIQTVDYAKRVITGDIPPVAEAFSKIKEYIRNELNINDDEYEKGHGSCGVVLFMRKDENKEKVINTLLREAKCMSAPAIIKLKVIYQHNVEEYKSYRSKIFDFFKMIAEEGMPRGQFIYGQILLYGWNGTKDVNTGLKFLKLASDSLDESAFELGSYFYSQHNIIESEKYFKKSANLGNSDAMYELAIFALERRNHKEAADWLHKTLALDPYNDAAKIELSRLYVEGLGIKEDCRKGFDLMAEVAEKTTDKKAKAISNMNLGLFYMKGVGTEQSLDKAKECFCTALKFGYDGASQYIKKIDEMML